MISLRIEFLTGRFVACEFNDRGRAEWPPHPARVFSTLVSNCMQPEVVSHGPEALRWLEQQPPPSLTFSDASHRDVVTNFVPVNDKALSDASAIDKAWITVLNPDLSEPQRVKAEAKLHETYAKQGGRTEKLGKDYRSDVEHVLPRGRTKQARFFPSTTPADPVVWMSWHATPPPELRAALEEIASRASCLGHSSSMISACWTAEAPSPTWVPSEEGTETLRWVERGQLAALEQIHARGPAAEQRIMPYTVARYSVDSPSQPAASSDFSTKWITFRRIAGTRLPIGSTAQICEAIRGALIKHADQPVAAVISGHGSDGGPLQSDHVAVVALPHVASKHATGDLIGAAMILPERLADEDKRAVYASVARWESHSKSSDARCSQLVLGRLGEWTLERTLGISPLHNLQDRTWLGPSRWWTTVTPMLLDHHPGSLADRNRSRRTRAIRRTTETIRNACVRIGLPAPESIRFQSDPFVRGSIPAEQFRRSLPRRDPRPLLHVQLQFAERVTGPVLLGALRYRGIGLLRPTEAAS